MPVEPRAAILLVEDDIPQSEMLGGFLEKRGYRVGKAHSAAQALSLAEQGEWDLLLTDLRLGGPDGVDLLRALRERAPDLQGIVLTAYGTVDDAIRAMKAGAYDFLSKPVDLKRLEALIEKALERVRLSRENRGLSEAVAGAAAFDRIVGESPAISEVRKLAAKVAPSKASVLILGESGTGKEVLARSIHLASPRKNRAFIAVNCAALPETLIESELFGYEKGAFTGAAAQKKGRFELADGGTLFLDEVGEMPLHLQVKLLNVIQSGRFERVGGTRTVQADVRIISATNRDLARDVEANRFREDLFFRLNVVAITMPPLRERSGDIPLLARHFMKKQADLSGRAVGSMDPSVLEHMERYPFFGNVRELENWIERACVLAEGEVLTPQDFPQQLFEPAGHKAEPKAADEGLEEQVARLEMTLIREALDRNKGNQSAAARDLKITERSIRYKMKKHGFSQG